MANKQGQYVVDLKNVRTEDFVELFDKVMDHKHMRVSKTKDKAEMSDYLREAEEMAFLFGQFTATLEFAKKKSS